jgi:hypothetical protein
LRVKSDLSVSSGVAQPASDDRSRVAGCGSPYGFGRALNIGHELGITNEVGDPVFRQARLPRAEHLARATQLQVTLRYDKAIVGVSQYREPATRDLTEWCLVQQYAVALFAAAAYPPTQLVQS